MKLIILGTGNAMVTRCYNTCFAITDEDTNEFLLVDAGGGNGILSQCQKAGLELENTHNLFLTHAHTDHILGVIWVIRAISQLMNNQKYDGDFTVWTHDECKQTLEILCRATLGKKQLVNLGTRIHFNLLQDAQSFKACQMDLTAFDIHSTKKKQYGFKAILPDGKKLVCLGDEPCSDSCRIYAQNADWLLTEAFCLYEDRDRFKPYEKHHSTALDAAKTAQSLNVKNLLLYHTEDKTLDTRKERYTNEAKTAFTSKIFVPDDLEVIEL